jgi:hypothetical protein
MLCELEDIVVIVRFDISRDSRLDKAGCRKQMLTIVFTKEVRESIEALMLHC